MRRVLAVALAMCAAFAVEPGSTHGGEVTCSGTAPVETGCSAPFEIGDHGLQGMRAWTTPGFLGSVTIAVRTQTGIASAACGATGAGGYLICEVEAVVGSVKAGQNATLEGKALPLEPGLPPVGRWMAVAEA